MPGTLYSQMFVVQASMEFSVETRSLRDRMEVSDAFCIASIISITSCTPVGGTYILLYMGSGASLGLSVVAMLCTSMKLVSGSHRQRQSCCTCISLLYFNKLSEVMFPEYHRQAPAPCV